MLDPFSKQPFREVGRFELRAGWEVFPDSPVYSATNSGRLQLQSETPVNWSGVNRFRRVWAGLAVALIAKDCFSVPLMPFGTDMTFWSFDILAAIFWTLNLPVSCWLARSKATVWPLFLAQTLVELVLIAPTFVDLLNHGQPHPLQSILRVLQLFRLLQASHWYKITGMSHMVREWLRHRSREFRAFWNIASIMLIGVLLIHLITCMWFAAGVGGEDSWVDELDITDKSWQQQYLLSFEWAIGRLPPSHLPENMKLARRSERFVALLGTGLMILFGSIFTSMITNDISDIRRAHRERKEADYHVRDYLRIFPVAPELEEHLIQYLQRAPKVQQPSKVVIENVLPEYLFKELCHEALSPVLKQHSFFRTLCSKHPAVQYALCKELQDWHVVPQEILFSAGPLCERMLLMVHGDIKYTRMDEAAVIHGSMRGSIALQSVLPTNEVPAESHVLHAGHWICEPCLWTAWAFVGKAASLSTATLVCLSPDKLIMATEDHKDAAALIAAHARKFVAQLNDTPLEELSDTLGFSAS